jgi:hypothetical protein
MGEKHIEKWWYFFLCWVFQTSTWVGVIAYVINFTFPEKELIIGGYEDKDGDWVTIRTSLGNFCLSYCFIGPISYIIYIALEMNSVTHKYLEDFSPNSTIKSKMDYWIGLKPDISIK